MAKSTQLVHPGKAALRRGALAARDALSAKTRREASRRIVERVLARPEFIAASGVHCFISLPAEVDTRAIFEACWDMGKIAYVPYLVKEEGRLGWASRSRGETLVSGEMNVMEPTPENRVPVPLEDIDLLLVPGVAFDRMGNRLGYGKGYYDNFIGRFSLNNVVKTTQKKIPAGNVPPTIALAFSVQIVNAVPQDPWDRKMDVVLTESGAWTPEPCN